MTYRNNSHVFPIKSVDWDSYILLFYSLLWFIRAMISAKAFMFWDQVC